MQPFRAAIVALCWACIDTTTRAGSEAPLTDRAASTPMLQAGSWRPSPASDLAWPRLDNPVAASTCRYTVPPDLGDGIHTGAATALGLGPAVLEQPVQDTGW